MYACVCYCVHTSSPMSLSPAYSPLPTCRPSLPHLLRLVPHTQSWWSTSIWWNWQVHLRGHVVLRRCCVYVQWWHNVVLRRWRFLVYMCSGGIDVVLRRWRRGQIWFCTYACILWYDVMCFVLSVRACSPAWLRGRPEWIRSVVTHCLKVDTYASISSATGAASQLEWYQ